MRKQLFGVGAVGLGVVVFAGQSVAAPRLIESAPIQDVDFGETSATVTAAFAPSEGVIGVGLTGTWTGVVVDSGGGVAPWSIDMGLNISAPGNAGGTLNWFPIGGDVTFADFPIADFTAGWNPGSPDGDYEFTFTQAVPAPFVSGMRNAEVHLLADSPDFLSGPFMLDVTQGDQWNRPFFIGGISGLGPVYYDVIDLNPTISGGYVIESTISTGNSFIFLYKGGFDPNQPLNNLLDYSLGNGNFWDQTPQGEGRISALLFAEEEYTLVASQWSSSSSGQTYTVNVTGPGAVGGFIPDCAADLNSDGIADYSDYIRFLQLFVAQDPEADLNNDNMWNQVDYFTYFGFFLVGCLPS